jgi:hypothetical protein
MLLIYLAAQRQVLPASAGFGGKKPKGEPAFGAESPQVRATPALVRCKRCWAVLVIVKKFHGKAALKPNLFMNILVCKIIQFVF